MMYHDRSFGATLRRVLVPPLIAVGFVLAGSADWALVLPGEVDCAVDPRSCYTAQEAIRSGYLRNVPRDTPSCVPYPGCRPARNDYIDGFNMPGSAR